MKLLARRQIETVDRVVCGCCGTEFPRSAVHELMNTPGVFLCRGCGLWVATRISRK